MQVAAMNEIHPYPLASGKEFHEFLVLFLFSMYASFSTSEPAETECIGGRKCSRRDVFFFFCGGISLM